MKYQMTAFIEDGGWMVRDTDPLTLELFGTDTLPMPFLAATPASSVRDVLERLNPEKAVEVIG